MKFLIICEKAGQQVKYSFGEFADPAEAIGKFHEWCKDKIRRRGNKVRPGPQYYCVGQDIELYIVDDFHRRISKIAEAPVLTDTHESPHRKGKQ